MIDWGELSASEKAEFMRICISNGVRDLGAIRELYNNNEYRGGGGIHIKPENRGKFTALKKRTGKSASWFKAHGTPAQRKMATFALNARKWRHDEGGYLDDDDEEYFGGTLPAATITEWLPEVQSPEGKAIAKNMAERVANGQLDLSNIPRRYYNYVRGEAEGAIPMRDYMDKATNVALGTLAVPLATMAIAEAAPVLAPGNALWSNPIMQQAVASEIGGRAVDLVSKDFTGKTWAENMSSAFDSATGLNSSDTFVGQMAAEMTNPGYLLSPSHFISRIGINRLPQAAFDSNVNRLVKESFTPSPKVVAEEPKLQQFPEVVKTTPKQELPPYEIEDLGGGYMLKSLMRGNPLEKQLSKQGTVNVNNIKSLINKGSDIEKTIVDKVLSSDEFANKKSIDYNKFRRAVQDELIAYDREFSTQYKRYGLERIGFNDNGDIFRAQDFLEDNPTLPWHVHRDAITDEIVFTRSKMKEDGINSYIEIVPQDEVNATFGKWLKENNVILSEAIPKTYTFSSPRIPQGSAKHYNPNTLGHSRTYTTADEPNVLHVMESQSDWAQSGVTKEIKGDLAQSNDLIDTYNWRIDLLEQEINTGKDQWGLLLSDEAIFDKRQELSNVKSWLEKELERNKELASTNSAQAKYLSDNYTTKQIQENLRYAAEQGQTKMRYPTRETAAKIEGYPKETIYVDELDNDITKKVLDNDRARRDKKIAELMKRRDELINEMKQFYDPNAYGVIHHKYKSTEIEKSEQALKRKIEAFDNWKKYHPNVSPDNKTSRKLRDWQMEIDKRKEALEIINRNDIETAKIIKEIEAVNNGPIVLEDGVRKVERYKHENILKRYSDFPKQYRKLFKNADVRTVTDSKGNTWYEVDVPKDYLKKEWIYSTIPVGIGLSEGKEENSYANGGPLGDKDTLSHPKYNASSEKAIYDYLARSGLNNAQVSGIMGNLAVESLLNSNINQFNGPAYGLIQAEGVRKKALKEYQGSPYVFGSGLLPEEQKQLDYIIDMGINNYTPGEWGRQGYSGARAARNAFINSSDVDEASDIFMKNYLRPGKPNQDRRRNMSNYYFNKYGKSNYIFKDSEWNLQNILTK